MSKLKMEQFNFLVSITRNEASVQEEIKTRNVIAKTGFCKKLISSWLNVSAGKQLLMALYRAEIGPFAVGRQIIEKALKCGPRGEGRL